VPLRHHQNCHDERRASWRQPVKSARSTQPRDIDHYDALAVIRDRFFGLRCAINGAGISSHADRCGLQQIAEDIADSLGDLCAAFSAERDVRVPKR
jgi:hypothetical protein